MNLLLPVPSSEPGPTYAYDNNQAFTQIDAHTHAPGQGVPITPSGLNINSDLAFGSSNATLLRSARFAPQSGTLAGAADLGCVYVNGLDLWFNDVSGNTVRLTQSGGVAGSPGSISNLTSPASAAYVSSNQTFVWQSGANTPANMDMASVLLRNLTANSRALTLNPPASMAANYAITLPPLGTNTNFLTMDTSGNMAAVTNVDGSTITNTANVLSVGVSALSGITGSQLSPTAGITGSQIATDTVSKSNLVVTGFNTGAVSPGQVGELPIGLSVSTTSTSYVTSTATKTATITIASPAVITITSFGSMFIGMPVVFSTTGALPTGITAGTYYYVLTIGGANTIFTISATPGGAAINTTGSQSGTQSANFNTQSIALTTLGGPVSFQGVSLVAGTSYIGITDSTNPSSRASLPVGVLIGIFKGGSSSTAIAEMEIDGSVVIIPGPTQAAFCNTPLGVLNALDRPSAGINVYTLYYKVLNSTNTLTFSNAQIAVREL